MAPPDRRREGQMFSTNAKVLGGGILCLVMMAVYKAIKETHPDNLALRHHGTSVGGGGWIVVRFGEKEYLYKLEYNM